MTYEKFKEYALENYMLFSLASLKPTEANLQKAFEVYMIGAGCGTTRLRAVKDVYGRRYRRMEDFLREIDVWRPSPRGRGMWAYFPRVLKLNCFARSDYKGRRAPRYVEVDIELTIYAPLNGLLEPIYDKLKERVLAKLESDYFPPALVDIFECQREFKEQIIADDPTFLEDYPRFGFMEIAVSTYTGTYVPTTPRYHYNYSDSLRVDDLVKEVFCS